MNLLPYVPAVSFEARRQARFRDAFAKIEQSPPEHREAGRGSRALEEAGPEPVDPRVTISKLSFEAWMAGKSLRPPEDQDPSTR